MADAVWPADLPQALPLLAQIQPVDRRGMFEPDAGPAQIWALDNQPVEIIHVQQRPMVLSSFQRGVLVAFTRDTLLGGTQAFDWVDPWPLAGTMTFRFAKGGLPIYLPTVPARDWGGRVLQITYDTTFTLEWFPWFPASQVG